VIHVTTIEKQFAIRGWANLRAVGPVIFEIVAVIAHVAGHLVADLTGRFVPDVVL